MDNKQKIVVNYIPPEFQDIPLQEQLEDLYEQFVFVRGKTARKVGIIIERRMKKRYYATHMYEELTEDNVFARASSSKVAKQDINDYHRITL
ncbi:hypothetical protein PVAND_010909 [Polypedilum vanderplanki]|uniref:Uncharacterized protein n=1 Tax=Polypedilum vanderplanki TaxID=319348 RepID=A0A9J6CHQ1_POLVA|nr:hypothetical protein PVAND_010909 [Polypedilum vanderplanki]